jgi:hypothetical protein
MAYSSQSVNCLLDNFSPDVRTDAPLPMIIVESSGAAGAGLVTRSCALSMVRVDKLKDDVDVEPLTDLVREGGCHKENALRST